MNTLTTSHINRYDVLTEKEQNIVDSILELSEEISKLVISGGTFDTSNRVGNNMFNYYGTEVYPLIDEGFNINNLLSWRDYYLINSDKNLIEKVSLNIALEIKEGELSDYIEVYERFDRARECLYVEVINKD